MTVWICRLPSWPPGASFLLLLIIRRGPRRHQGHPSARRRRPRHHQGDRPPAGAAPPGAPPQAGPSARGWAPRDQRCCPLASSACLIEDPPSSRPDVHAQRGRHGLHQALSRSVALGQLGSQCGCELRLIRMHHRQRTCSGRAFRRRSRWATSRGFTRSRPRTRSTGTTRPSRFSSRMGFKPSRSPTKAWARPFCPGGRGHQRTAKLRAAERGQLARRQSYSLTTQTRTSAITPASRRTGTL